MNLRTHKIQRYGWIRDRLDPRDIVMGIGLHVPLPASVDLCNEHMPAVYDQLQVGSCTGNAVSCGVDYERSKQGESLITPSRLFIYYNERVIEGTTASDSGAQIRDGIKVVAKLGVCPETIWPYDESKVTTKPTPDAYTAAVAHRALRYTRVTQVQYHIKHCLAVLGVPVIFGFLVYEDFESEEMAKTGIMKMPEPGARPIGGHAVAAVGYDDASGMFKVRNSWGSNWGLQGYFKMPYEFLLNPQQASDFWAITLEA